MQIICSKIELQTWLFDMIRGAIYISYLFVGIFAYFIPIYAVISIIFFGIDINSSCVYFSYFLSNNTEKPLQIACKLFKYTF